MKILKTIGLIFLLLFIAGAVVKTIYLTPHYVICPPLKGAFIEMELEHEGHDRVYHVYVPQKLQDTLDLVFVLHGSRGKGEEIREQTAFEFDLLAEDGNAIIVYPTGFENHWNDCRKTAQYSANTQNIDDIGFLKKIEEALIGQYKIGVAHVFATGLSNGGHFAYKLALEAPDWVTAVAAIAANFPTADNMDCTPVDSSIAVLVMNGTTDPVNPYQGGDVSMYGILGSRGTVISAYETINYWTTKANYDTEPILMPFEDKVAEDGSTVKAQLWNSTQQPPIALFEVENGGHTIPHPNSALPALLGTTNKDINAPKEIWSFFQLAKMK